MHRFQNEKNYIVPWWRWLWITRLRNALSTIPGMISPSCGCLAWHGPSARSSKNHESRCPGRPQEHSWRSGHPHGVSCRRDHRLPTNPGLLGSTRLARSGDFIRFHLKDPGWRLQSWRLLRRPDVPEDQVQHFQQQMQQVGSIKLVFSVRLFKRLIKKPPWMWSSETLFEKVGGAHLLLWLHLESRESKLHTHWCLLEDML